MMGSRLTQRSTLLLLSRLLHHMPLVCTNLYAQTALLMCVPSLQNWLHLVYCHSCISLLSPPVITSCLSLEISVTHNNYNLVLSLLYAPPSVIMPHEY